MPERIKRFRRRRRISAFPAVEAVRLFRDISPERLAVLFVAVACCIVVAILAFTYGSKIYGGWREKRLLQPAEPLLHKRDFNGATAAAQKVLQLHPDSLAAYYVLADATE